jgi:hypothetical protein
MGCINQKETAQEDQILPQEEITLKIFHAESPYYFNSYMKKG